MHNIATNKYSIFQKKYSQDGQNSSLQKDSEKNDGFLIFAKELSKYFMEFLETNFNKEREPKRYFQRMDKNNFLGINLRHHETYNRLIWKSLRENFQDGSLEISESKNKLSTAELVKIKKSINLLKQESIDRIIFCLNEEINSCLASNTKNIKDISETIIKNIKKIINNNITSIIIEDFFKSFNKIKALDQLNYLEERSCRILTTMLKENIQKVVRDCVTNQNICTEEKLRACFELKEIKFKLENFLKNIALSDIYHEVLEIFNSKKTLEKQDFYLNFCHISYEGMIYPIFYMPIQLEQKNNSFDLIYSNKFYANKKALRYVAQSYNEGIEKKSTSLESLEERIICSDHKSKSSFFSALEHTIREINVYFSLSKHIDLKNSDIQTSQSTESVKKLLISNGCSISLFDKSDEAIINDYEDILYRLSNGDSALIFSLKKLINNFIKDNPQPFTEKIDNDFDRLTIEDKLVCCSPVALNEEQRKILIALREEGCNCLSIEGPPGTGKSHTITAIVCDAILNNKSILMLSDKESAIDVIESKITSEMEKIRLDKNFQNPILRLGKLGGTCSKILSNASINKIKEHYKEKHNRSEDIEKKTQKLYSELKGKILKTIKSCSDIDINVLSEFHALEMKMRTIENMPFELDEINQNSANPNTEIEKIRNEMMSLKEKLSSNVVLTGIFEKFFKDSRSVICFQNFLAIVEIAQVTKNTHKKHLSYLNHIQSLSENGLSSLKNFVKQCSKVRFQFFGYALDKEKINGFCDAVENEVKHNFLKPHRNIGKIEKIIDILSFITMLREELEISGNFKFNNNFLDNIIFLLKTKTKLPDKKEIEEINNSITNILCFAEKFKMTAKKSSINSENILSLFENEICNQPEEEFISLSRYIYLKDILSNNLGSDNCYSYLEEKTEIERLTTMQMASRIDRRVIDLYNNRRNDCKSIRSMISKRKRFDKEAFSDLKNTFPCMLANIRNFSEYLPLEPEILDIVIVDEASQVSIAQVFPALLRAKKIIVLGDKKQFSNVSATHARSCVNNEYLNRLEEIFFANCSQTEKHKDRLKKFNIKTSALDFFENISNYNAMLTSHFRGYRELISYSNKNFYENSLQTVKIRLKPVNEIIKFTHVRHDGKFDVSNNRGEVNTTINQYEIDAILNEVQNLCSDNASISVGIITPSRDQRDKLEEAFINLVDYNDYRLNNKLKIMTFDGCQGEERDVIMYSMVANPAVYMLHYYFIKDLKGIDLEEKGQIRAQRLNVGFSRAKECMHFFLSLPIESYKGSIGEAIRHYKKERDLAEQLPTSNDTDLRSPMEAKVLEWIQETSFFKRNRENIEIKPQFKIGAYLKQIDRFYNHPKFIVDFLLILRDDSDIQHKIVVEYDGMQYHFEDHELADKSNYENFYTDRHVYREKILESYGLKFLRLNRFNITQNPVTRIDSMLNEVTKKLKNS